MELPMDCAIHVLSDVHYQCRNHPITPLRSHVGVLGVLIDSDCCYADYKTTPDYQQSSSFLVALYTPPRSFGRSTRRLICTTRECSLRANSACESILPIVCASLLP
jgi:hypothetical protein